MVPHFLTKSRINLIKHIDIFLTLSPAPFFTHLCAIFECAMCFQASGPLLMLSLHPRIPSLPFSLFKVLPYLSMTNSNATSSLRPFHILLSETSVFLSPYVSIACFILLYIISNGLYIHLPH